MSYLLVVKGRKPERFDVNTRGEDGEVQRGPSTNLSWRQLQELLAGAGVGTTWIPLTMEEIISEFPSGKNKYATNIIMAFRSAE